MQTIVIVVDLISLARAEWLAAYLQEVTTFPAYKHDDQANSTSQALDWVKQDSYTYPVYEYYRRQELRANLGLPDDYRFVQCDEDEPIIAIQDGTGHTIIWTGHGWAPYR